MSTGIPGSAQQSSSTPGSAEPSIGPSSSATPSSVAPATRLDTLPGGPEAAGGLPGFWYVAGPSSQMPQADSGEQVQDGYVWRFLGPGKPGSGPPPLDILDQPACAFEMRTVPMAADWRLVLENSLDFAHSAFVHSWTSPVWLIHHLRRGLEVEADYRPTADGLTVDARAGKTVLFRHSYHVPDRMRLTLLPDGARPVDVLVHHAPDGPGRTRMEILVARKRWPWERPYRPGQPIGFKPGALELHRQDARIVEAQQQLWGQLAPEPERHCAADAYTLLMRRVLEAAADGQRDFSDLGPARLIHYRF